MTSRILYVDDQADVREIAVLALQLDPSFEVRSSESGRAALEVVSEWRPDLVLLDVCMPEMDGPQTLTALRAIDDTKYLPVAFISARAQPQDVGELISLGAVGVIAKPFDPMNLAEMVRGILSQ